MMVDKCKIKGCSNVLYCSEICSKHYIRFRRYGTYEKPKNKRGTLLELGKSYCCSCKKEKPLSEFNKDKQSYYGFSMRCKECNKVTSMKRYKEHKNKYRNYFLLKKFGIGLKEYNKILKNQKNRCLICGNSDYNKHMPVDHCHKTGHIRGILCSKCNLALGLFNDDIKVLNSAITYLNKSNKQ